jgi:hypothetical protein
VKSIHARCLAVRTDATRTLVCGKSKGHTASVYPERRQHYDPSADVRWSNDKETP